MNATTHPVAPEEVMALLDGELSVERAQAVSTHLDECAECRDVLTSIRKGSQSLATWSVPAAPESIPAEVSKGVVDIKSLIPNEFVSDLRRFFSRRSTWALGGLALALLMIFVRNLSRPAASRQMMTREQSFDLPEKTVAVGPPLARGDKASLGKLRQPIDDQQSKVISMATPGVAADSNGLFHGLGDHSQNSFSVDGQPISRGPMIARAASLSVYVKDFDAGRASLDAILARHQGYAASLSVSTPQGAARVIQASLRIPDPQLAAAFSELKALGRVEGENQGGEEVTQQHADLVARIKNDRETEVRLQDILEKRTGKVKDVLEVEQEIARVRGEIEQMEAEQKALEHRVEFATIDLRLSEEYKAQLNTPAPSVWMQLHNAGVNGFRNAFEALLGIVLFLVESGPSIVLWLVILGSPAWLLWRRYRRAHALGSLASA